MGADVPAGGQGAGQGGMQDGPYGQGPGGLGQTDAERVAALDRALSESLEGFEGAMGEEQIRVAQAGADQRDTGGGSGSGMGGSMGGMGDFPTDGGGMTGGGQQGRPGQQSGPSASGSSESDGAPGSGSGGSSTPPDVGDGTDDDIVARQLREAAENEKDPELREKLWDEYRKYKKTQN
jgi:hypothetical protein